MNLRRRAVLWMCVAALGCDAFDEPLDAEEAGAIADDGSTSDGAASADAGAMRMDDAAVAPPGNAGGDAGGGGMGGSQPDRDASSSTGDLDAGASPGSIDASSTGGVVIGPSMRRDGGPARWDPDAAGPILNADVHAACNGLAQNICSRLTDCQVMIGGLTESRRNQVLESCRNNFLRTHNCNRATATASGFAACSEETKTRDCVAVLGSDYGSSCVDQITFQR